MEYQPALQEWDEITVTGTALYPEGTRVERLACMVANVFKDEPVIKVWPMNDRDPQLTEREQDDGKLYFRLSDITYERDEESSLPVT